MNAIKFADQTRTALDIRLVPFGGSINGRDTSAEFFSTKTNLCLDWFPDRRPLLYHHGLDGNLQTKTIGYIESVEVKSDGAWARAQLDAHHEYYSEIVDLIDQNVLGASSGAMAHLVKKNGKTGHIDQWPLVEGSLTPTPCEPMLATVDFATAKAHYKSANLNTDVLKAVWSQKMQDALPDSAFLYVESGGEKDADGKTTPRSLRHFPVRNADGALDEAHVKDALGRIPQSTLPQAVKDKALGKARKYAKALGIDVADDATKAAGISGVCAQCLKDNEAGCLCASCIDGTPAACLCDAATYGMSSDPPPAEPEALTLDGCYEDRIQDIRDAVNQSGPMAQYVYNELLATFADYAVVCRWDHSDDGPGDQTYWRIPYALVGDDPVLDLSQATQLDQVYVPAAKAVPIALSLDAHALATHAAALSARTKGVSDARLKEGRVLSVANRTQIATAITTMQDATRALQSLLDTTDKTAEANAKAAALASPDARARRLRLLELAV